MKSENVPRLDRTLQANEITLAFTLKSAGKPLVNTRCRYEIICVL